MTLADFAPRVVEIEIRDGERVLLVVPLAALSWSEYHEINMSVDDPDKPMKKVHKGGQIVYEAKTDGPEFEAYRAELNEVIAERKRRRLAVSLIRAGNLPELKEATIEEQAAAVDRMDTAYVRVLYDAMEGLIWQAKQRVVDAAERFRPDNGASAADMPEQRVDAGDVVEPDGA